jgi:hypothetical protein
MTSADHWVEILRCLQCGKTGAAELSQPVDSVPEGFRVLEAKHGWDFVPRARLPSGTLMNPPQTTIMPIGEPRPRGSVLGERADRRRVREAEHFFRCKACKGWIDARDYVWVEDHDGPVPHPAQDQAQ